LGDDQSELEDRAELEACCGSGPRDEVHVGPGRAGSVNEKQPRRDARYECADEQPAEYPSSSLNIHCDVPPYCCVAKVLQTFVTTVKPPPNRNAAAAMDLRVLRGCTNGFAAVQRPTRHNDGGTAQRLQSGKTGEPTLTTETLARHVSVGLTAGRYFRTRVIRTQEHVR
jgi:hypothetical protein